MLEQELLPSYQRVQKLARRGTNAWALELLCMYLWSVHCLFPVVFSLIFPTPCLWPKMRAMATWIQPGSSWQGPLGHPLLLGSFPPSVNKVWVSPGESVPSSLWELGRCHGSPVQGLCNASWVAVKVYRLRWAKSVRSISGTAVGDIFREDRWANKELVVSTNIWQRGGCVCGTLNNINIWTVWVSRGSSRGMWGDVTLFCALMWCFF